MELYRKSITIITLYVVTRRRVLECLKYRIRSYHYDATQSSGKQMLFTLEAVNDQDIVQPGEIRQHVSEITKQQHWTKRFSARDAATIYRIAQEND